MAASSSLMQEEGLYYNLEMNRRSPKGCEGKVPVPLEHLSEAITRK